MMFKGRQKIEPPIDFMYLVQGTARWVRIDHYGLELANPTSGDIQCLDTIEAIETIGASQNKHYISRGSHV